MWYRVMFMIKNLLSRYKKIFSAAALALFVLLSSHTSLRKEQEKLSERYHSDGELSFFKMNQGLAPGEYFLGSKNCKGCHGKDVLQGIANVDSEGNDVNLFDDWAATMMALSAKDPLWRAQLSREIHTNPNHAASLENKCTSCHAPMGHYTAFFKGNSPYRITDMLADTLGLDGVSCMSCHIQGPDAGSQYSGVIQFDTTRKMYGPYEDPMIGPMQLYTGLIPTYGPHMHTSNVCASCHTLVTDVVDLQGNYTGEKFVEQSTYHEWVNSSYPSLGKPCQTCHMPSIRGPVVIANDILNLPPRSPFNLHKFMGANTFMLQLMKANKAALGITATDTNFDSSIVATMRLLTNSTLDLNLNFDGWISDTVASFNLKLTNLAGHKFPSGYPSRRAFVRFVATTQQGDTIFKSGMLDPTYELVGHDANYEPHHQLITSDNQVQIYEMVMTDVAGNRTTLLERAKLKVKDNRLVPLGFLNTSPVYDTVYVAGTNGDPDFNVENGSEGSGTDRITYHIRVPGGSNLTGSINVYAQVFYQAVPPRWVSEMFDVNTPEINTFESMYNSADKSPVLVASTQMLFVLTPNMSVNETNLGQALVIGPNPTVDGMVHIISQTGLTIRSIEIFDMSGRRIESIQQITAQQLNYVLSGPSGQYIIKLETDKGNYIKKVVKL